MLVLLSIFIDLHCPWLKSDRARYDHQLLYWLTSLKDWHSSFSWSESIFDTLSSWGTHGIQFHGRKMKKIKIEHNFSDGVLLHSVAFMIVVPFCLKKIKRTACSELLRCIPWSSSCVCVLELQSDRANPRTVPLHWSIVQVHRNG